MTRRGLVLFAAMGIIWGLPYVLIKVAVGALAPATLVFLRTAIGALLLAPVAWHRGQLRALWPYWRPLLAYTFVELAVPWVLLSTAEQRLPSSLSGLLVAAVPLVGALLARGWADHQPLGRRGVAGLVLGLAGVGCLVGFNVTGGDAVSMVFVGFVVLGYAAGPLILSARLRDAPALGVVAGSLALCALAYAPYGLSHLPARAPSWRVDASVAVLGVACTALAFVLFFALITEVGPVRATVITYINPAVAVLLGVAFLHEDFGLATAVGFALILTGSYFATRARRTPATIASGMTPAATVAEP